MRFTVRFIRFTVLLTASILGSPASVGASGSLFDALRHDDPAAVTAAVVAAADVNAPDETGTTPLMHAVLYARPAIVELLLDRGAATNAANGYGSTALMWAAPRPAIVRILLSRGADVNAKASDGTTPLIVAARVENVEAMRALIAAGADVNSPGTRTLLLTAAYIAAGPAVRDYLQSLGITVQSAGDLVGPVIARHSGDQALFERLLAAGADPHGAVPFITLSLPTYFVAARAGRVGALSALEKAGVNPKAKGPRGWTPLMLTAGDDDASVPAMEHLLAVGVEINAKDDDGRTALDWALTRGETAASEFLRRAGATASAASASPTRSAAPYQPKEAVTRAVAKLQPAGPSFSDRTRCNSCHNQNLPAIAINAARARSMPIDQALATHSFDVTQQNWRGRREFTLLGDTNRAGFQLNVEYGLFDFAENGVRPTPATDAMVLGLAVRQQPDGSWPTPPDIRPPMTASIIVSTALALRGIRVFAPPGRREEMESRVSRAARFLRAATPSDTQDQAFKMLGLLWAGAPHDEVGRERSALAALQRADGGWAQLTSMASDAYATGQAMFALHAAGASVKEPLYRRAVDYLLKTQLEDGTWFVRTRAFGFQPYFETGFPYGRSQFISTAATAWAATALAYVVE
jgi:ankyrin repeat protein